MNYVYILKCADKTYYTGWTTDVAARLCAHNSGKGAKYTKSRRPVRVVYTEATETKSAALRREAAIKKLQRTEKERLISEFAEKERIMQMKSLDILLANVEHPARYTGGEWGSVYKNTDEVKARFAFCFPDSYEVGMSHLGMKILYGVLNNRADTYCERFFAPWPDMEEQLIKHNVPLFSQETHSPLGDFDIIGFTLQYELSYTNILNMLSLGGVPLTSAERSESDSIVCAGGPCAYNPEPLADIIDFFMMGEGEELIDEVMDIYVKWKQSGQPKKAFFESIAELDGIYVPSFYDVEYNSDNTVKSIKPNNPHAKAEITKRIILDMDKVYYPEKFIVPNIGIVHDRIMLEVFRGCTRGCRFCQAGAVYRPVRERSPKRLLELAKKLIDNTGYEEISMTSLSTSDYTGLAELCEGLISMTKAKNINLSLPSLRIDNFSLSLMEKIKKSGLTFAPEAGTQRLRDVINKNITEDDITSSTYTAFSGGYNSVKLYFMLGLPTETDDDVIGISALAKLVCDQYYKIPKEQRIRGLTVTVSTSCFVPKPHTAFQWVAMDSINELKRKQDILKAAIRSRSVRYNWHDAEVSYLEAVFARGDRRLNSVLINAHKACCKFDGWSEYFSFERWNEVFSKCGIDPDFYVTRQRETDEVLPWEHINAGVSKEFFLREYKKAQAGETTARCTEACSGCGANKFGGGICFE